MNAIRKYEHDKSHSFILECKQMECSHKMQCFMQYKKGTGRIIKINTNNIKQITTEHTFTAKWVFLHNVRNICALNYDTVHLNTLASEQQHSKLDPDLTVLLVWPI